MRAKQLPRTATVDLRSEAGRALSKSGMWMIVAYVGASTLTIGLLRLVHGEGSSLSALLFVLAGGALAAFAWRSAYRVIDRIDASPAAAAHEEGRSPAGRSTSGLTTLIGAPEA
jgi:hypothetical protein